MRGLDVGSIASDEKRDVLSSYSLSKGGVSITILNVAQVEVCESVSR